MATPNTQKPLLKRLKIKFLCFLAYWIYRALTSTYRVRFINLDYRQQAAALHPHGSFVYGLWHEYFFTAVATHPKQGIAPMISQSQDGELISSIAEKLGFKPVRGSTSRGGADARTVLYERISSGLIAAFTADGPRGPRRKLKSGLVDLSRTGQMPILPLAIHANRSWVLTRSWDHSLIPKPFAEITVVYGEPFIIAKDAHGAAFAAAKERTQIALNAVASKAEALST